MRRPRALLAAAAAATLATTGLVAVTVTVAAPPAAALENGLARTPPMGFNNWNTTQCKPVFNEGMIRSIADIVVSAGLRDAGYQYINIDDCWAEPNRNAQGQLVPNRTRFPSGIRALADYVHARGLKFGIYTSAGTHTCNDLGFPGALDHEASDARQFASFQVDYLKYDNCNNQGRDARTRYTRMRDALAATGRPMVYSITEWGQNKPWEWAEPVGNLWRTTGDISDNWARTLSIFKKNVVLSSAAGPGHWNDPDMLEVGNGKMTTTEYRSHFTLWAIMAAPLLIGADLRRISTEHLDILRNRDVIAVDQDTLGRQATIVSNSGGRWVLTKPLANGDRAVALFNENATTMTISTTAAAVGMPPAADYTLRDLWSKASRTTTGAISASVPAHGTVIYRVSSGGTIPGTRFEAEDATISQGTVDADHAGFSGRGFVNYTNVTGSFVEWRVTVSAPNGAVPVLRFANGTAVNRPMDISVDGAAAVAQNFPATGNWDTWQSGSPAGVTLTPGTHTIRATATTANGGPNVDFLELVARND